MSTISRARPPLRWRRWTRRTRCLRAGSPPCGHLLSPLDESLLYFLFLYRTGASAVFVSEGDAYSYHTLTRHNSCAETKKAGRGGRGERLPFPLSIWGAKEKPPVTVTFGFGVITACVSTAIASCVSAVAVIYLAKSLGVEAS